jgi:hypothetical protein
MMLAIVIEISLRRVEIATRGRLARSWGSWSLIARA